MAALLGVDVDRTISLTFVMGAALAAVAGLLFMIYYGVVHFNDGFVPGVKAFTAAVLGGIGSLPGAVLGGLLIGLIETLWSALLLQRLQGCGDLLDPGDHRWCSCRRVCSAGPRWRRSERDDRAKCRCPTGTRRHHRRGGEGCVRHRPAGARPLVSDPRAAHRSEHGQPARAGSALGLCRRRRGARLRGAAALPALGLGFAAPGCRGSPRRMQSRAPLVRVAHHRRHRPAGRLSVPRHGRRRAHRRHQVDRQFRHPDPDLRDARLGPQHRGRPRRPARSRLRRLLRHRRLRLRAAGAALRPRASGCACRWPAFWRPSGASCSAFRCCGCAATTWPSSRWRSARSSASSPSTGSISPAAMPASPACRARRSSACRSRTATRASPPSSAWSSPPSTARSFSST